jgi:hypothetical protein
VSHQETLTVVAKIKAGQVAPLARVLGNIAEHVDDWNVIPFADLDNLHFARLVIFDTSEDLDGNELPPQLALLTNVDAPLDKHIEDLVNHCGTGLDEVFGFCEDYPNTSERTPATRREFIQRHKVAAQAVYVNRNGRTVAQIRQEQQLNEAIHDFLDNSAFSGQTPTKVRDAIVAFVRESSELQWAMDPVDGPGVGWQLREWLHRIGWLLIVIVLSPFLLLGLPVFALLLRYYEKRDVPDPSQADAEAVKTFRADEDHWAHNQIIAIGLFKPGLFRRLTARLILGMTDYACRHIYNRGFLSGLNTIHFARWVELDEGKRLFFSSNYDGSLESYMNDFIDKAAWGLNAIFSNGDGFPRTQYLFCGGITDEKAYKRFLPTRQVHSRVWYSAYPRLTTKNIANNAEIRAGLSATMNEAETRAWLQRFGVGNQLPESGRVARILDRLRWDRICRNCN